mgnify:CR=1 FL=1
MGKKSTKSIFWCLIVILALCGMILVLLATSESSERSAAVKPDEKELAADKNEGADKKEEAVYVFAQKTGALQKLRVNPWDCEAFCVYTKDAEAAKRGEFLLEGMETFETDAYALNNLIRGVRSLMLYKDLGKQENKVEYGLEPPRMSVTAWFENTEAATFAVGGNAPSGGNYILYQDHVYVGRNTSWVDTRPLTLLDTTVISIQDSSIGVQTERLAFDCLTIQNADITEPLVIRPNPDSSQIYAYRIEEPVRGFGNDDAIDSILNLVKNLEADHVAAIVEDKTDLSQYGLDEPQNVLTITTKASGTHSLRAGKKTEDGWYVMADDKKVVYLVGNDTVSVWTEKNAMDIRSPLILVPKLQEVSSLVIQTDERVDRFEIDLQEGAAEKQVMNARGRKISVELFRQFYQKVIGLQIYDTWVSEIGQDAYMVIEYQYYGENKKDTIVFYNIQDNERTCLVHVNGETVGVIRKTTLDELVRAVGEISQ